MGAISRREALAGVAAMPLVAHTRQVVHPQVTVIRLAGSRTLPQPFESGRGTMGMLSVWGPPDGAELFYSSIYSPSGGAGPTPRVNAVPWTVVSAGTIRGPQCARGRADWLHAVWNSRTLDIASKPMGVSYARVDVRLFHVDQQKDLRPHVPGLDGGCAVAADHRGTVAVFWHAPEAGQDERAARIWMRVSQDDGVRFGPPRAIDPGTDGACGCCGMTALMQPDGTVHVLYRTAKGGQHRDTMLLSGASADGAFRARPLEPWAIGECPMSSYSLAYAGGRLLGAWETAGQVRWADLSAPQLRPHTAAAPAGAKYPGITANGAGDALIAWAEGAGYMRGGSIGIQILDGAGTPRGPVKRDAGLPANSMPGVAAMPDGNFLVVY